MFELNTKLFPSTYLRGSMAALAAATLLAGCATQGGDGADGDDGGTRDGVKNATMAEPMNLMSGIPPTAEEVARGKGSLAYTSDKGGMVYLYDLMANDVVATFHVEPSQTLRVAGESGRATLAGNNIVTKGRSPPRGPTSPTSFRPTSQKLRPPVAASTTTASSRTKLPRNKQRGLRQPRGGRRQPRAYSPPVASVIQERLLTPLGLSSAGGRVP